MTMLIWASRPGLAAPTLVAADPVPLSSLYPARPFLALLPPPEVTSPTPSGYGAPMPRPLPEDLRRPPRPPAFGFFLGLLLVACPARGRAQLSDSRTLFIGEGAQGLATAYTAVADGPTAAFHNPAGLASARSTSLSSSLTLLNVDRLVIDGGFGSPGGVRDLDSGTGFDFPFSIGFNAKLGPEDDPAERRNSLAFTTFSPLRRSLRFDVQVDAGGAVDQLRVDRRDTATWYGLSYARRLTDRWLAGVSVFVASRTVEHVESQTAFVDGGPPRDDGTFTESVIDARDNRTRVTARHLLARLGALWQATPRLRLGAMLQPPGIPVGGDGEVRTLQVESDLTTDPPRARRRQLRQTGLSASLPIPWELRLGTRYLVEDETTLVVDAGLTGWQRRIDLVDLPSERQPGVDGADPLSDQSIIGFFLPRRFTQRATANFAVGMSGKVRPRVPIRGGLFFESPTAGPVPESSDRYAPIRFWTVGASIGVGFRNRLIDLDLGLVAQLGFGEASGLDPNRPDPGAPGYVRRDARRFGFLVFLGGYKATASRLAEAAYEQVLGGEMTGEDPGDGAGDDDEDREGRSK